MIEAGMKVQDLNYNDIKSELEYLYKMLYRVRSRICYLNKDSIKIDTEEIGVNDKRSIMFPTAPLYKNKGFNCAVILPINKLTEDDFIEKWNNTGHWVNENFIVRVCSLLEYNSFFKIDLKKYISKQQIQLLEILSQLRHIYAHSTNLIHKQISDRKKKVKKIMLEYLDLSEKEFDKKIPIHIDTVIEPIYKNLLEILDVLQEKSNSV